MERLSTRRSNAVKAAGEVAQRALQSAAEDAVREALKETDYVEVEESADSGRSGLLFAGGVVAGYLLAKQSPSWLDSAEKSVGERSSGQIDRIAETVVGGGSEGDDESETGYDANGVNEGTRVGSDGSGEPNIGADPAEERPDIGSTADQGRADVGSGTDEATQIDSDADEYGTEDTNVGPGGEDYGESDGDEDAFDSDEGRHDDADS